MKDKLQKENNFNKAILLVGGGKIGGAERRFARAFIKLTEKDNNLFLIINQKQYESLIKHGIPLDKSNNVVLIKGKYFSKTSFIYKILSGIFLPFQIIKIIRNNDIRFLHSMGIFLLINSFLFTRLKNVYKGISIFSSKVQSDGSNILTSFLFKIAIIRSDFIDFLSEDIEVRFIKKYGKYFNGKYYVSPCSFSDYSLFTLNDKEKDNSVVFVGRLIEEKNPNLFIDAIPIVLEKLSGRFEDIKFHVVGEGPLEKALRIYVKKIGIQKYVTFSYACNTAEILCKSKIFISIQNINNYPSQSLLESMACGNAIVATDVGETWKLIDDSTGIKVTLNSQDIANAIVALFNNPDKLKEMGKNARKKVLKEHTIERFVEYLLSDVYNHLAH